MSKISLIAGVTFGMLAGCDFYLGKELIANTDLIIAVLWYILGALQEQK
jgi:hypothetical protein